MNIGLNVIQYQCTKPQIIHPLIEASDEYKKLPDQLRIARSSVVEQYCLGG
jgi:hypothetical protein